LFPADAVSEDDTTLINLLLCNMHQVNYMVKSFYFGSRITPGELTLCFNLNRWETENETSLKEKYIAIFKNVYQLMEGGEPKKQSVTAFKKKYQKETIQLVEE
jgi:hypothetical protein